MREQPHLGDEAEREHQRRGGKNPRQPRVRFARPGAVHAVTGGHGVNTQAITLVALGSSLGGVSKVCHGAGDGTSHSRPSAASHGRCGAGSPLPRIIGSATVKKKYTCARPKPKAPIDASALKSANCSG